MPSLTLDVVIITIGVYQVQRSTKQTFLIQYSRSQAYVPKPFSLATTDTSL